MLKVNVAAIDNAENLQWIDGCPVPYGYEVWKDGVFKRKGGAAEIRSVQPSVERNIDGHRRRSMQQISQRPFWVSGLGMTLDTSEPLTHLCFHSVDSRPQELWIERGHTTEHLLLQKLGGAGLPVDSLSTRDCLVYLRAGEQVLGISTTPLSVASRCGSYRTNEGHGFLLGSQWIGAGHLFADPRRNTRYTQAFTCKGSWETWRDEYRKHRDANPIRRFTLACAFASPLLRFVGCRTFIVHHWGESSFGKSATAMFGLSAFGDPHQLYMSMDATIIAMTEVFKHVDEVTVLFDELQVAQFNPSTFIYAVCQVGGRERGSKYGGLRQDRVTWKAVVRTTGEVPIVGAAEKGGEANRVLQYYSQAFHSKEEAEKLYAFFKDNYGHAGPRFLQNLMATVNLPGGVEQLQEIFHTLRGEITRRSGIAGNHVVFASVIALASILVDSWLLGIPAEQAQEDAINDACLVLKENLPIKEASYAERALGVLRDHRAMNPYCYIDLLSLPKRDRETGEDIEAPLPKGARLIGAETAYGLAFIPSAVDQVLRDAGYDPGRVWRDFSNRGWLYRDPNGPLTALVDLSLKHMRHPVYVVRPEIYYTDGGMLAQMRMAHMEQTAKKRDASLADGIWDKTVAGATGNAPTSTTTQ